MLGIERCRAKVTMGTERGCSSLSPQSKTRWRGLAAVAHGV